VSESVSSFLQYLMSYANWDLKLSEARIGEFSVQDMPLGQGKARRPTREIGKREENVASKMRWRPSEFGQYVSRGARSWKQCFLRVSCPYVLGGVCRRVPVLQDADSCADGSRCMPARVRVRIRGLGSYCNETVEGNWTLVF
jgi:hypothetical protein